MNLFILIAVLVSFLGTVVGAIISFFTKEELKEGQKYFLTIQGIAIALIAYMVSIYYAHFPIALAIALSAIIICAYYLLANRLFKTQLNKTILFTAAYALISLLIYFGSMTLVFASIASIPFLFNLSTGSIISYDYYKKKISLFIFIIKISAFVLLPFAFTSILILIGA